ncbi:MAG: hypothetical protein HC835_21295 [Oscillatoriales cyanobacterium RM2_1_1]|nr:hypothetical protein [Oscillatoriales cyanobacterium SM2_3_0]NJO47926.1 hypothetical protein [Oscillatoriales cyanobacterium RM2_1_1]
MKLSSLDQIAQLLVLNAKKRDPDSLNQSYKMRMAAAYGLERFWGEHLRLQKKEPEKSAYWKETWDALVSVMKTAGVEIPNDRVDPEKTQEVYAMSQRLWTELNMDKQRVAIAVLTQLCDCIVWWTQRYKGKSDANTELNP